MSKVWSRAEVQFVKDNAGKISVAEMADMLERPVKQVYRICSLNGIALSEPKPKEVELPPPQRFPQPHHIGPFIEFMQSHTAEEAAREFDTTVERIRKIQQQLRA